MKASACRKQDEAESTRIGLRAFLCTITKNSEKVQELIIDFKGLNDRVIETGILGLILENRR